jgi:hypothetical protein
MYKDITESAHVKPGPSKENFLHYYGELWTNNSLQENYWNTENVNDEIITTGQLKEAIKTKNGKSPGEDNLNSDLLKTRRKFIA